MNNTLKAVLSYLSIIVLVILIRLFLVTPIIVNGPSMNDTLYNNDVMILNKIGYQINGVKRFDVVVIKYGDDHIIKRVIGLPGEIVKYKNGVLYVNGKKIDEPFIDQKTEDFSTSSLIKNGVIPVNTYFVVGDNRNNSYDSRYIGFIKKADIMGKTNIVIFPFKHIKIIK